MRVEPTGAPPGPAASPEAPSLQALLEKLSSQDMLADCLALQSSLRSSDHRLQRQAVQEKRTALAKAERELREAQERDQKNGDLAGGSTQVAQIHGVLAALAAPLAWWAALIHGLGCAGHIGQATYFKDKAADAQRDQVRAQAAMTDAQHRKLGILQDMHNPIELEQRMRARLTTLVELEHQTRHSALGGGHEGRARG
jgi:hypothetical protein